MPYDEFAVLQAEHDECERHMKKWREENAERREREGKRDEIPTSTRPK